MSVVVDAPAERLFVFGEYALDEAQMRLLGNGQPIELEAKPFFVLRHLLSHAGRVVGRDELMREVWHGVSVSDASLKTAVYAIRQALGDSGPQPRFIATIRGTGYRFCAPVEVRPLARAPAEPVSQLALREDEASFVDRETEMQRLHGALAAAAAGERRLVFLHGPPGIGKTRTALELAREAERRGFEVHIGRTHEDSGAPPFWPWRQILRSLATSRAEGGLRAPGDFAVADVLRLAPELARHLPAAAEHGALGSEESRFSQLDGVTQLLSGAAQVQPLLLILDDLQWADEASLALLRFLARNLRRAPLLIVATHREFASPLDDAVSGAIRRAASEGGADSLALKGLGREAIQQTLRRRLDWDAPERWVDEVLRATGGNPFFVLELARLLKERSDDREHAAARLAVPQKLRDAVLLRIEERSAGCRTLLRCASAIGETFALSLLRRVVGMRADEALDALREAERADLMRPDTDPGSYRFAHGVVRDVLYELLPETERVGLHAAIAEALEQGNEPPQRSLISVLAHHFAQAAPVIGIERALSHVQRAADEARLLHAFAEEATHCRQALELLAIAETPDPELRCSLLLRLGWALSGADAPVEQVERALGETSALARQLGRVDRLAHAAVCRTRYVRLKGHTTFALDEPGRARVRAQHTADLEEVLAAGSLHPSQHGRVVLALAGLAKDAGQHERAERLLSEVLRSLEHSFDAELRATTLIEWFPLTMLHPLEERARIAEQLIEASRLCARKDLECFGHGAHVYLALVRGDRAALDAASQELARLATETRLPRLASAAAMCRSLLALLDGQLESAGREAMDSVRVLDAPPVETMAGLIPYQWWSGLLEGRLDRIPAAAEALATIFQPAALGRLLIAYLRTETGRALEASDRDLDYAALLAELPQNENWLWVASLCLEQCVSLQQRERGEPLLELLLPHADQGIAIGWICVSTGALARPLGSLAALLGRWHECEELFETALAHADSLRSVTLRLWTQIDYSRALRRHPSARMRRQGTELADAALQSARDLALPGAELRLKRA